jgi:hypothetical protein|tara:strand:+ start:1585 stop:2061 length:477 start_codon:yes stop_codon:yes gene_type:complete
MTKATQTSRTTRASATRKKVWEPMKKLDIPENKKQADMEYVWVRHELLNNTDDANVHERLREGYEPVTPNELGDDYHADVMSAGKHAGTVRSGDLILMKNTKELVDQKKAYYEDQTRKMGNAYNAEYMRQQNPNMPVTDDSTSSSTRGGRIERPKFEK